MEVDSDNRLADVGEPFEIESYTGYKFEGRGDTYSPFKWHWYHFSGVDNDKNSDRNGIFRIVGPGKGWSQSVDDENANYDYLMCNDIDLDNPIDMGEAFADTEWHEITENIHKNVTLDASGKGSFPVSPRNI